MIEKGRLGRTGRESTRVLLVAAALGWGVDQVETDCMDKDK
jgi:hypothetical protein